MVTQVSIAQARDRLPKLVHDVEHGPPVELTRRGKPVAVLVSAEEYQRLAAPRGGFAEALLAFRRRLELEGVEIGPEVFEGLRDRSPGRDFSW